MGTETLTVRVGYFFYSHNYGFGYGVPGTHSGVLTTWRVNDQLTIEAGWTTGWDSWWSNYLSASTLLGGLNWSIADGTSLTYHLTAGDFGDGTTQGGAKGNRGNLYAHAILLDHQLSCSWHYALEQVFGTNTGLGPIPFN